MLFGIARRLFRKNQDKLILISQNWAQPALIELVIIQMLYYFTVMCFQKDKNKLIAKLRPRRAQRFVIRSQNASGSSAVARLELEFATMADD